MSDTAEFEIDPHFEQAPVDWALDPLEDGSGGMLAVHRVALVRIACVAAETGARMQRDGLAEDPVGWMVSPLELFDISLPRSAAPVTLRLPAGHTAILFVRRGELAVGGEGGSKERVVGPQGVALMEREGEVLRLTARTEGTQVLLLGGEPLNEPIAARGPFVMTTEQELVEAARDYQSGRMGQ